MTSNGSIYLAKSMIYYYLMSIKLIVKSRMANNTGKKFGGTNSERYKLKKALINL